MADHLDSPFVSLNGKVDITDLYVFHPPPTGTQDLTKTVLVLNVNPFTVPGLNPSFSRDALYQIKIDTNGDAHADIIYTVDFRVKPFPNGTQLTFVSRGSGLIGIGATGAPFPLKGGGQAFAGLRDDPFFFDLLAFLGLHDFGAPEASDTFAGTNVSSIVLEVPTSSLGTSVGVWATVSMPDGNGHFFQVDRMGRPAINTVFIPKVKKNLMNSTSPSTDQANFLSDVTGVLRALDSRTTAAEADGLGKVLLPDTLTADLSKPTGFVNPNPPPLLNGRNLPDDVIDVELQVITGLLFGRAPAIKGDGVNSNDKPFLNAFPYLAEPH